MKRCKSLVALFLALTASGAKAQFTESFTEPRLGPAWNFVVPGNNIFYQIPGNSNFNSEDPSQYNISGGAINITQTGHNIYYGANVPSVTVAPGATGDFDIKVTLNYSTTSTQFPTAGLVIFKDTNNFIQLNLKNNGGNGEFASVYLQSGGNRVGGYDNLANYANVSGPTVLHINKTGTVVTFSITPNGGTETMLGTVSAADAAAGADPFKTTAYGFLSDLSGLRVGFTDDNYDGSAPALASFSNFSTTLPLVIPPLTDNFLGPKLTPMWQFNNAAGANNEDAPNYSVGDGVFVLNNHTYSSANSPAVTVKPNAPTDYDVRVAVDAGFNPMNQNGAEAGLEISTDANNYFHLYTKARGDGNTGYPNTYAFLNGAMTGNYDNYQQYYPYTGNGPVLYHINKTGTTITLGVTRVGDMENTLATLTPATSDTYGQAVYAFLSDLSGKQIRLYNTGTYTGAADINTVAFSRFYTTLPLVLQQTFADEFNGPALSQAFSFNVTNNNPSGTGDPANYSVANGFFNVNFTNGGFPYAKNVASVTVGTGNTGDYWIETAVKVNFAGLSQYPLAGLVVFTDANNYAQIGVKHNVGAGNNYPVAVDALNGVFNNDLTDYSGLTDGDDVVIRIRRTGGTITLSDLDAAQNEHVFRTVDATSTGGDAVLFNLLNNIDGKRIGFLANNGGGAVPTPASFDYLRTSLNIIAPEPVTGSVKLEGVPDLTAVSPNAPLGVFDVQFRSPGSTSPTFEFKNVTLTPSTNKAIGTFSVSVLPGTYDVWIKGSKNLAVLTPGVVISATGGTVSPVTLPAGDTNNDNFVDSSDFGTLIGAFNTDSSIANGSGYDPTADLNFDGVIDSSDFGLLIGEFNNAGAN